MLNNSNQSKEQKNIKFSNKVYEQQIPQKQHRPPVSILSSHSLEGSVPLSLSQNSSRQQSTMARRNTLQSKNNSQSYLKQPSKVNRKQLNRSLSRQTTNKYNGSNSTSPIRRRQGGLVTKNKYQSGMSWLGGERYGQHNNSGFKLMFNKKKDDNQSRILTKLRQLEEEIQHRQGFSDILYRQQQLEEAVQESNKINLLIEEERQKLKQKQHELLNSTLSTSKLLTHNNTQTNANSKQNLLGYQKEIGIKDNNSNSQGKSRQQNFKSQADTLQSTDSNELKFNTTSSLRGSEHSYRFKDNYEFYISHLNKQGLLVQQQEQIQNQINEQNSRLVKLNPKTRKPMVPGEGSSQLQSPQTKNTFNSQLGKAMRGKLAKTKETVSKNKFLNQNQSKLSPLKIKSIHNKNESISSMKSGNQISASNASHSNTLNASDIPKNLGNISSIPSSKIDMQSKNLSYKIDSELPTPDQQQTKTMNKQNKFFSKPSSLPLLKQMTQQRESHSQQNNKQTIQNEQSFGVNQKNSNIKKQISRLGLPPIINKSTKLQSKDNERYAKNQENKIEQIKLKFNASSQNVSSDRIEGFSEKSPIDQPKTSQSKLNRRVNLNNQTLDEQNLKLPSIYNKLTNSLKKYEQNVNNQTLDIGHKNKSKTKSNQVLTLVMQSTKSLPMISKLQPDKREKSLSPEQKVQLKREQRWNIHLNADGVQSKLVLLKKAKQYYLHDVRETHIPKTDSSKQVEVLLRKSANQHRKAIELHKPIKRIHLESLIDTIEL